MQRHRERERERREREIKAQKITHAKKNEVFKQKA
jgi:hypothetical protein